jgi:hypothetical protein
MNRADTDPDGRGVYTGGRKGQLENIVPHMNAVCIVEKAPGSRDGHKNSCRMERDLQYTRTDIPDNATRNLVKRLRYA